MSELTVELLTGEKRRRRHARVWPVRFAEAADILVELYGRPTLGNYDDPVREIFYIVLSAKTADANYRRTDATLWSRFAALRDLAGAPVSEIKKCIVGGGLANKKAAQLKQISGELLQLGDDPATALRDMPAERVYGFLTALPGVGPKSALCIMMCSLGFDVFPVDVNVSRIASRMGAAARGLKHYEYTKLLPPLVPAGRSKDLHVGLVVHGRTVCLPKTPKCNQCRIAHLCRTGERRLNKERGTGNGEGEGIEAVQAHGG